MEREKIMNFLKHALAYSVLFFACVIAIGAAYSVMYALLNFSALCSIYGALSTLNRYYMIGYYIIGPIIQALIAFGLYRFYRFLRKRSDQNQA